LRREMPDLAPDDMDRQIEHVVGDLLIGYIAEILLFRFFRSSALPRESRTDSAT
jgi:hypothetical protein